MNPGLFFAEAKCRLLQNVMYVGCCKQTLGATPPNPCKINGCGKSEPTFTPYVDSAITYKRGLQSSVFYSCNKHPGHNSVTCPISAYQSLQNFFCSPGEISSADFTARTLYNFNSACQKHCYVRSYKRKQQQAVSFRSQESIDSLCQCMSMLVMMRQREEENLFEKISQIFG